MRNLALASTSFLRILFSMPRYFLILISFTSLLSITSCLNQKQDLVEAPAQDLLIGRVSSIYAEANYILIQKYRQFEPSEDAVFYTRSGDGSTHSIKMTGQRLGQFYVADIDQCNFMINDPVFMRDLSRKVLKPADAEAPTAAGTSTAPPETPAAE